MHIQFTEEDNQIIAHLSNSGQGLISGEQFRDLLEEQSFLDYYVIDENIKQLFHKQHHLKEDFSIVIARKEDCVIEIEVEPDKLSAYMTVIEAHGGEDPKIEDLIESLKVHKISYGVIAEAIDEILASKKAQRLLVARGDPPIHGEDAEFEPLVEILESQGKPKILEGGQADFKDLQIMTLASEGQQLMKKIPPTEGKPGINIYKEPIPQKKGKERAFGQGRGSQLSPYDPNLLLANTNGQIKVRSNFVSVEPIFQIDEIGYQSGNIYFPGTVIVDNDVKSNFTISAAGDILVSGTVEAARLISEGEILLHSGVVGNKQAFISADGNIQAKFIESANLYSSGAIMISDMLLHSSISAADYIEVGSPGSKGQIAGGQTKAQKMIKAKILGSPASTQTYLEVGSNLTLQFQLDQTREQLKYFKQQLDEVIKGTINANVSKFSRSLSDALQSLREFLLIKVHELTEKESILCKKLETEYPNGKIVVTEQIFAGVTVRIGDYSRTFNSNYPGATLYIDSKEKEIAIGSL